MSFNGLIAQLPIGLSGLTGTHSLSQVVLTQLLAAENLTFENGTLQKEGGALKYNASAISGSPKILGAWDWFPTTVLQRLVVFTADGKLLKDTGSGSFGTVLATGLSITSGPITSVPVFVEGGSEFILNPKKLFIFTGANQLKVLSGDGIAVTNVSKPSADWAGTFPVCGTLHDNRLWGAMQHRVYFSQFSDHEDFQDSTNAGSLAIYPGEGESIVSIMSFKGQLLVFKYPSGIYVVNTTDPTIVNWTVTRLSKVLGAAGSGVVINIDDDVLFCDPGGVFHLISATQEQGDYGLDSASKAAQMDSFIRDNLSLVRLRNAQAVFYSAKREVHFGLSQTGAGPNNSRLVVDINVTAALRWRYSDRDINETLFLRRDVSGVPRLACGTSDGFIYLLDQVSRVKDGQGYVGKFQSPHLDMSHIDPTYATKRKNGHFLELIVEPKGNWNLLVDIYWDGKYHETVSFNMGVTGDTIGNFELDTDVLGADQVLNQKKRITGSGRRISIVGYNSGVGEDFSVSSFFLHYTLGTEML